LVYLLVLLIPNTNTILFWEFYFLPFSVHVQTNVIYVPLLSLSIHLHTLFKFVNWLSTLLVSGFIISFLHTKNTSLKTCGEKTTWAT
jgi:hypothetical protein